MGPRTWASFGRDVCEGRHNQRGRTRDPRNGGEGTMSPAIKLLGTVVLERVDGVVDGTVPTSKALDLLRLLVAAEGQERGADHYAGLLWPSADEARGRMSLRTAVAQLRRALGPDAVLRSGDLLTLGDVETDV